MNPRTVMLRLLLVAASLAGSAAAQAEPAEADLLQQVLERQVGALLWRATFAITRQRDWRDAFASHDLHTSLGAGHGLGGGQVTLAVTYTRPFAVIEGPVVGWSASFERAVPGSGAWRLGLQVQKGLGAASGDWDTRATLKRHF